MIDLSICIPTFNRAYYLDNCLNSIKIAKKETDLSIEVCISDNCSTEKIEPILNKPSLGSIINSCGVFTWELLYEKYAAPSHKTR